tara:strand:- start:1411 stop:1713 length:303 start_codon:yes stop_codon:yes gene_type:complete
MASHNEMLLELEALLQSAQLERNRYKSTLFKIIDFINEYEHPDTEAIQDMAQISLDGEPSTADEFNIDMNDEHDNRNAEILKYDESMQNKGDDIEYDYSE